MWLILKSLELSMFYLRMSPTKPQVSKGRNHACFFILININQTFLSNISTLITLFSFSCFIAQSTQKKSHQKSNAMQFTTVLVTAILALTVAAAPQASGQAAPDAATIASLVPDFGVQPGQGNNGTGDCVTPLSPKPIQCDCPPPRDQYLSQLTAAVQAGNTFGLPAPFPTGADKQSEIPRLETMLSVLQNVKGAKGSGCPAISTVFKQKLDSLTGAAPAANAG
jgi:hypothetical protein